MVSLASRAGCGPRVSRYRTPAFCRHSSGLDTTGTGTGHRGVAGDVHGEDEQHAEVGQDVAADVEDAGVVPAPSLSYARPRDGSPDL